MKKTLIALAALSGLAFATETVTLTPLTSSEGWAFGRAGSTKGQNLTLDTAAGSVYNSNSYWNKSYAVYTLDTPPCRSGKRWHRV